MIDTALVVSAIAVGAAMWVAALAGGERRPGAVVEDLLTAALVGVLIGRGTAVLLDDPQSLRSLRAFLVIRGGVEFWPGAVAAAALVARRGRPAPALKVLATVAPLALAGYGAFEAACLLREGCYGPHTLIGLRPDGLPTTMLPVGVVVGAALAAVAVWARTTTLRPAVQVTAAVLAVATARSIASIWLPRLGDALTRQHRTSVAVAVAAAAALVAMLVADRGRRLHPA